MQAATNEGFETNLKNRTCLIVAPEGFTKTTREAFLNNSWPIDINEE
ncbi:hypothetical protein SynSYN20_00174 [Synechococcus sp. SYN20]|nr:hypothetical protein SynSYN20_00174 [Synechococcus sp. SYN20]